MKIGLDARFISHPQRGGFKTYTENLVEMLSRVDQENQYTLYLDRAPGTAFPPGAKNFTSMVVPRAIPGLGTAFREQVLLRIRITIDRPDVVHFLCNTAPARVPGRSVLTLHDVIQVTGFDARGGARERRGWRTRAISGYSKWAILRAAPLVSRIITPSRYEKQMIVRYLGVDSDRVTVIHLASSPVFGQAPPDVRRAWRTELGRRLGLPDRFVLGIGYEPRKNIPLLIEAFSRVVSRRKGLGLVIVAAQNNAVAQFRELAANWHIADQMLVLGPQEPSDLAALYNLAEVFVFPSERESFGLPPLEAMACGTPTIAMNKTSIPEIVEDGGLLLDGTEPNLWADAIEAVLTDEDLRARLALRGVRRASTMTWRRCAEETLAVYKAVAEGS